MRAQLEESEHFGDFFPVLFLCIPILFACMMHQTQSSASSGPLCWGGGGGGNKLEETAGPYQKHHVQALADFIAAAAAEVI